MTEKLLDESASEVRQRRVDNRETVDNSDQTVATASHWKSTIHYYSLPHWLQDNEYLHTGHRPPLPDFRKCVKSIFSLHSETVNIWTHMLGCLACVGFSIYFFCSSAPWQEKLVMSPYLIGAIVCLAASSAFHTFICHSENVCKLFGKLDYCGIALLITCSFIPSLYYAFYCHRMMKIFYIGCILVLGLICVTITLWETFSEPRFRSLRAGVFAAYGFAGVVPTVHYMIYDGYWSVIYEASFGCLMLMALLYSIGAALYATRVPERFFPGKCDLLFQSHQLLHLFVMAAAFVHYHGIQIMANKRAGGVCGNSSSYFG